MTDLDPTRLLFGLDPAGVLAMFWFVVLIDLPRYTLGFLVVVAREVVGPREAVPPFPFTPLVSVVLAGHNERASVARCVRSLREQSWPRIEIVCVDDGSTDGMMNELRRLRAAGLVDIIASSGRRGGKSSALNLGLSMARGEVVITTDCDCTFDRDAVHQLVAPLADPAVGAVTGNIAVREAGGTILESLQAVEYLVGIGLGRRLLDMLGQLTCASGAFSAFRRSALIDVGGLETGAGEDLDLTLRLRRAGWTVRFAADAWCVTDVPCAVRAFVRQRMRWERDALRLRLRKYRDPDPAGRGLRRGEFLQQAEFVLTNVIPTLTFPLYLLWLVHLCGSASLTVIALVTLIYSALDAVAVLCALAIAGRSGTTRLLPYALLCGPFQAYVVRGIRVAAYLQEWIFRRSYHDTYVPARVLGRAPRY